MPQTGDYLVLGLVVIIVIMGVLIVSMVSRARGARRDLEALED